MGTTQKLTIERIMEVSTAIDLIGDSDFLDGTTAYRLGRLKSWCSSIIKLYHKERQRVLKKYEKEISSESTSQERRVEINNLVNDELLEILQIEEEIKIPELKLSSFIAKTERTVNTVDESKKERPTITRQIKEGDMLLPQKFFSLMGDLIVDDKSTGEYVFNKSNLQKRIDKLNERSSQLTVEKSVREEAEPLPVE